MLGDSVNTYGWDAESEIKSAGGVNYTYDGDGNRVQKSNGKIYWYGAGTEILDESDSSGNITDEYVFFGGERVAHRVVSSGSISYYVEDFLGTSRALTTSTGTLCYDADFYPYGGERVVTNTCAQNYKFEGKERDAETGNDDFGARYYTSRLGRFMSADPVAGAESNPQTLNRYTYVANNPTNMTDPLGLHCAIGAPCPKAWGDPTDPWTTNGGWGPGPYYQSWQLSSGCEGVTEISCISYTISNYAVYDPADSSEGGGFKSALAKLLKNPNCAQLLGGTSQAESILAGLSGVVDVSGFSNRQGSAGLQYATTQLNNDNALAFSTIGSGPNGGWNGQSFNVLVGPAFDGQTVGAQLTILLHELIHANTTGNPFAEFELDLGRGQPSAGLISLNCGTEIPDWDKWVYPTPTQISTTLE